MERKAGMDAGDGNCTSVPDVVVGSCFIVCVAVPCVWNGCVNYAESRQWMDVSMAALWKGLLWGVYTAGFITVVVFMALHKRLFFETWSGTRLASTIESE